MPECAGSPAQDGEEREERAGDGQTDSDPPDPSTRYAATRDAQAPSAPLEETFPGLVPSVRRKHYYTGAMGMAHFALFSTLLMQLFARKMGLSFRGLGLLMGLGSFAISFQILGAHLTARTGRRREFWFRSALVDRTLRALAVVAAFYLFRLDPFLAGCVFVGLMTLGSVFNSLSVPPWFSWLADLVPADQHGRFWGRRSAWTSLATVMVALPCAAFVDRWAGVGMEVYALLAVFAVGSLLGYIDLFVHRTIPEPAMKAEPERKLLPGIMTVLRDGRFRSYLVFRCAWAFSMALGGTMTVVFILEHLGFQRNVLAGVAVLIAAPQMAAVFTGRLSGRLIDRFGCRPVLAASHLVWAAVPAGLFFMVPGPNVAWLLAAFFLVTNVAIRASMNARTKLVTRLPRREDRSMYMAVTMCLASAAVGVGALVAGEVLHALEGWSWTVGGKALVGFHVLFAASATCRLASTVLIRWLPAPENERAYFAASECARLQRAA